jgi:hypothetical protein
MRLPNGERAVCDEAKLRDYCLNPQHARGRHKARVFQSVLGLTAADTQMLRDALLAAARTEEAAEGEADQYGQRYALDFAFTGPAGAGRIRSTWIVLKGEDFPRLTSCYVLR